MFKKREFGRSHQRLVIIFPNWKSRLIYYFPLIFSLAKSYRVVFYDYGSSIISHDIYKNIRMMEAICDDALLEMEKSDIGLSSIVGFSIGSFLAFMLGSKKKTAKMFLVSCSYSYAEFLWNGKNTLSMRRSLEKEISLEGLKKIVTKIEPSNNIGKIRSEIFLILSVNDSVIPYYGGRMLYDECRARGLDIRLRTRKKSHFWMIVHYLFNIKEMIGFLKEQADSGKNKA